MNRELPQRLANRVVVVADTLPEGLEKEPNNTADSARPVTVPIIINGRIDRPGDMDVFRFEGKAGGQIVAEVYSSTDRPKGVTIPEKEIAMGRICLIVAAFGLCASASIAAEQPGGCSPNNEGFICNWLLLDPIEVGEDLRLEERT
jgi:hypothetical protein